MKEEDIRSEMALAEQEFNSIQSEGQKLREQVQEIEDRSKQLQGKHQAYTDLLDKLPKKKDPATTIEAKEDGK